MDTDIDVYRRVMEVIYFGAIHCTRAALPSLLGRGGQIIAISSVAGFAPVLGRTGYAGAKHAMIGFFSSLGAELRDRGVSVLVVTPGFGSTNIHANALGGDGERSTTPRSTAGKVISAEQAAAQIVRASERDQRRLAITPVAKASRISSTVGPGLYEWIMIRSLGSELEGQ